MFEKIKQNAKTIIEISYEYEKLKEKKDSKKKKQVESRIMELIRDTNKEIDLVDKNAKTT